MCALINNEPERELGRLIEELHTVGVGPLDGSWRQAQAQRQAEACCSKHIIHAGGVVILPYMTQLV
jgi:hypothetical protein